MFTEQSNPASQQIDQVSTLEMLHIINGEDRKVAEAVGQVLDQLAPAVDAIVARLQRGGRLVYVGAGTSGRLAMLDAVECVPTYGTPPELVQTVLAGGHAALVASIEGAEDNREAARLDLAKLAITAQDVVVGVAASGHTPYVLEAVTFARDHGAATVGIACNVPAPLLDLVDFAIGVVVGPEVIAGSTRMKAGTAQKLILNMLSTGTMVKLGKVYGNLMVDVQATNQKLVRRAQRLVMQVAGVDESTAATLLEQADYRVKTAVVMHWRGVNAEGARQLLRQVDGRLRDLEPGKEQE